MDAVPALQLHYRYGVVAATAGSLVLIPGCSPSVVDRSDAGDSGDPTAVSSGSDAAGITADGRSFGPLPTGGGRHLSPSDIPDLVRVVGDKEVVGYADSDLLLGGDAAGSPAEARRRQESAPNTRKVPVYASDGTTVVDTFTVSRQGSRACDQR